MESEAVYVFVCYDMSCICLLCACLYYEYPITMHFSESSSSVDADQEEVSSEYFSAQHATTGASHHRCSTYSTASPLAQPGTGKMFSLIILAVISAE